MKSMYLGEAAKQIHVLKNCNITPKTECFLVGMHLEYNLIQLKLHCFLIIEL